MSLEPNSTQLDRSTSQTSSDNLSLPTIAKRSLRLPGSDGAAAGNQWTEESADKNDGGRDLFERERESRDSREEKSGSHASPREGEEGVNSWIIRSRRWISNQGEAFLPER